MRYATIILSILTIVSLNLILILIAVDHDPRSRDRALNGLIAVLDLSLVSSSGLLGIRFIGQGRRFLGAVFFFNIIIFMVAYILRTLGVLFTPLLLYGADIYWLNLYLTCLTRNFDGLFRPGSSE